MQYTQNPYETRSMGNRRSPTGQTQNRRSSLRCNIACLPIFLLFFLVICAGGVYLLAPMRTNLLLLGIDYAPQKSYLGRSDTIILLTYDPYTPYLRLLSIPRDLWVSIPNIGENRINTAHFFAEAQTAGAGPQATIDVIKTNFGVEPEYYVRIRFDGVRSIVNAMGGVEVFMPEPMAGYEPGWHHLTGNKALAFARNRSGSDDFFRMEHGQILIKAIIQDLSKPKNYPRIPSVLMALIKALDTNIPTWQYPRLIFTILRVGSGGIDSRYIDRDMAIPFITAEGANVLQPNWKLINPLIAELFVK